MNKKTIGLFISLLLILCVFSSMLSIATDSDPDIYKDATAKTVFDTGTRHQAFPGICFMSNNNLLVTSSNGSSHGSSMSIEGRISSDNGTTFGPIFTIQTSLGRTAHPMLVVLPNGNVLCSYMKDLSSGDECRYKISSDNGVTWGAMNSFSTGSGTISFAFVCQYHVVGNTVYGAGWRYVTAFTWSPILIKTTNNATTWSVVNWYVSEPTGHTFSEWGFLPLNSTHFIGMFCGENDYYVPWQAESFDGGVTWANWINRGSMTPGPEGYGRLIDPNIWWLNRDHNIIVLIGGRQRGTDSSYWRNNTAWVSKDNGTTWQNLTTYSVGYAGGDAGYTNFAQRSDWTNKGYIAYYDGLHSGNCDVFINHIYDNNSYPVTPTTPTVSPIQFISIDGKSNNTYLVGGLPTMIWNMVNDTDYYQLQIATSSNFSLTYLLVNLTDINLANYPVEYSDDGVNVTFVLPVAYSLPSYNRYYFRVRSYSGI